MKFMKTNWHKVILFVSTIIMPVFVLYAAGANPPSSCDPAGGKICPTTNVGDIPTFIKTILTGVLKIGIPVVALAVIYSGFLFVFARGNPEKLSKAKGALLYTVIGAAILLGSWAIAQMIQATIAGLS